MFYRKAEKFKCKFIFILYLQQPLDILDPPSASPSRRLPGLVKPFPTLPSFLGNFLARLKDKQKKKINLNNGLQLKPKNYYLINPSKATYSKGYFRLI